MKLQYSNDLFSLSAGDTVRKTNLRDLIQHSKVAGSPYWSGSASAIGNTPQQGINWIGRFPAIRAVIVKTNLNSYEADGWVDDERQLFRYGFKRRRGVVDSTEKANVALSTQPDHDYPILLFADDAAAWRFEGQFDVAAVESEYVILARVPSGRASAVDFQSELLYPGTSTRLRMHFAIERGPAVAGVLNSAESSMCEICSVDFKSIYGVKYIEAHHKATVKKQELIRTDSSIEWALLCPNCHRAVHVRMLDPDLEFGAIRDSLRR